MQENQDVNHVFSTNNNPRAEILMGRWVQGVTLDGAMTIQNARQVNIGEQQVNVTGGTNRRQG